MTSSLADCLYINTSIFSQIDAYLHLARSLFTSLRSFQLLFRNANLRFSASLNSDKIDTTISSYKRDETLGL